MAEQAHTTLFVVVMSAAALGWLVAARRRFGLSSTLCFAFFKTQRL
jgi:hypothetical protein